MDILTVTFVTACTALVSAAVGPLVSVIVSTRQLRASLISNNRERWIEALRDSLAEYAALAVSAALLEESMHALPLEAVRKDPQLARLVERVAQARSRIMLMVNPNEAEHRGLCTQVDEAYGLLRDGKATAERMHGCVDAIVSAGRSVLKAEWARVKRGD